MRRLIVALVVTTLAAAVAVPAVSQMPSTEGLMGRRPSSTRLGGHVGVVVPSIRRAQGTTTDLTDRFIFGFPVGLTVKPRGPLAVDFEFIPTFNTGDDLVVTIHPGVLHAFARHYAVGVRAAYDAGSTNESLGFTALLARGFTLTRGLGWFAELDVPVRWNRPDDAPSFTSIALAAHLGVNF